jgi:vacuolar-type H+-ATPase subunit F/Vma7
VTRRQNIKRLRRRVINPCVVSFPELKVKKRKEMKKRIAKTVSTVSELPQLP